MDDLTFGAILFIFLVVIGALSLSYLVDKDEGAIPECERVEARVVAHWDGNPIIPAGKTTLWCWRCDGEIVQCK